MLYIGIDWSDSGNVIVAMDKEGNVRKRWKTKQTPEDYDDFIVKVSELETDSTNVAFAIESPHHPLLHFLVEKGYTAYAPNPKSVDRAREMEAPSGKKDDDFDAQTLANMLRVNRGALRPYLPDSNELIRLRILCDAHRSLVASRTAMINQAKQCLKAYWPAAVKMFSRIESGTAIAFFQHWPDPVRAATASPEEISTFLKSNGYVFKKKIGKIISTLKSRVLPVAAHVREAKALQFRLLMEQLAVVCAQEESMRKEIALLYNAHPDAHIFRSLLPRGNDSKSVILIARLLCDFGDRRDRYASREEVLALSGVAPVTYSTSNGEVTAIKMRRACRKDFRNDVHQLADLFRQHYLWAQLIFNIHKKGEKKKHNGALRVLGDVLVRGLYASWKAGEPFDATKLLSRRNEQMMLEATRKREKMVQVAKVKFGIKKRKALKSVAI